MAFNSQVLVCPGFEPKSTAALDIGGSLVKLAYISKKDEGSNTVRLVTLPKTGAEDVAAIIAENCDLPKNRRGEKIISTTGVGTLKSWDYLEKTLDAKIVMKDEMSVLVTGFKTLMAKLGEGEDGILEPYTEDVMKAAFKNMIGIRNSMMLMTGQPLTTLDETIPVRRQIEDIFKTDLSVPRDVSKYLILSLGSGAVVSKVDGDTHTPWVDIIYGVGKTFWALGKLITGKQTFNELVELAERGDALNVHTVMADQQCPVSAPNLYNLLPPQQASYHLGKVTDTSKTKDDFSTADVMAGLLDMTCQNIMQRCYQAAVANDVEYVFITGGFVAHPVVRKVLARFALQEMMQANRKHVRFHMCKYSTYVEAIGGLLTPFEDEKEEGQAT